MLHFFPTELPYMNKSMSSKLRHHRAKYENQKATKAPRQWAGMPGHF